MTSQWRPNFDLTGICAIFMLAKLIFDRLNPVNWLTKLNQLWNNSILIAYSMASLSSQWRPNGVPDAIRPIRAMASRYSIPPLGGRVRGRHWTGSIPSVGVSELKFKLGRHCIASRSVPLITSSEIRIDLHGRNNPPGLSEVDLWRVFEDRTGKSSSRAERRRGGAHERGGGASGNRWGCIQPFTVKRPESGARAGIPAD